MKNEHIDIAIIGAGVSGVYSAWKLKKKYPNKKIVVFEGSDHVGGRLFTLCKTTRNTKHGGRIGRNAYPRKQSEIDCEPY